jgi:GcrA cell cycle regulator
MVMHVGSRDLSTPAAGELRKIFDDITQHRAARWFGVTARSIRRWRRGDRNIPYGTAILLRLLVTQVLTADQIERAAASIPTARTNGRGNPGPPRLVEPAPKQSAPARASAAALAICALGPGSCHFPIGDPQHSNFRFCGNPVVEPPYCQRHRGAAYVAPLVGLAAPKRFTLGSRSNPLRRPFHLRRRTTSAAGRLPVTIPSA